MLDLIKYVVGQFAEDKENVEYVVNEKDRVIEVTVILTPITRQARQNRESDAYDCACRNAVEQ